MVNVLLAVLSSSDTLDHDACTWYATRQLLHHPSHRMTCRYFLNVMLDSTLGLGIMYLLLKMSSRLIARKGWVLLYSGEYGRPPQVKVRTCHEPKSINHSLTQAWLSQMVVYLLIALMEKASMSLFMLVPFWQSVREFTHRITSSTSHHTGGLGPGGQSQGHAACSGAGHRSALRSLPHQCTGTCRMHANNSPSAGLVVLDGRQHPHAR